MKVGAPAYRPEVRAGRRILQGALLVGGFVLLAKGAAAAKEIAVAAVFGTGDALDAFLLALAVTTFPVSVAISALNYSLTGVAARQRTVAPERIRDFHGEVATVAVGVGVVFAAVTFMAAPKLIPLLAPGFDAEKAALAAAFSQALAFALPLGFLGAHASTLLLSRHAHANTLAEVWLAVGVLVAVLGWGARGGWTLVGGTLAGFAAQTATLVWLCRRGGEPLHLRVRLRTPEWLELRARLAPAAAAAALLGGAVVVDQVMASSLDAGSVSTLGYAARVMALVLGLTTVALTRAVLPVFSDLWASEDDAALESTVRRTLAVVAGLGGVALVVGWVAAPHAVAAFLERGAFSASDTVAVTRVLQLYLLQLPFYLGVQVVFSAVSVKGRHGPLVAIAGVNLIANILLNLFLMRHMGVSGIALSTSLVYALSLGQLLLTQRWLESPSRGR